MPLNGNDLDCVVHERTFSVHLREISSSSREAEPRNFHVPKYGNYVSHLGAWPPRAPPCGSVRISPWTQFRSKLCVPKFILSRVCRLVFQLLLFLLRFHFQATLTHTCRSAALPSTPYFWWWNSESESEEDFIQSLQILFKVCRFWGRILFVRSFHKCKPFPFYENSRSCIFWGEQFVNSWASLFLPWSCQVGWKWGLGYTSRICSSAFSSVVMNHLIRMLIVVLRRLYNAVMDSIATFPCGAFYCQCTSLSAMNWSANGGLSAEARLILSHEDDAWID